MPQNAPNLVKAKFHFDPLHGPVCTLTLGPEAGAPDVTERATSKHIEAYPIEWARFQNSRPTVRPVGMTLEAGLGMDQELISLFVAHGIADVETFATLNDAHIQRIMPGNPIAGINLRNRAILMVPEARRTPLPVYVEAKKGAEIEAARQRALLAEASLPTDVALAAGPTVAASTAPSVSPEIEQLRARLAEYERREAEASLLRTPSTSMEFSDEPEDVSGEGATEETLEGQNIRRGPGRPRRQAA